jgi:hypothetical protein
MPKKKAESLASLLAVFNLTPEVVPEEAVTQQTEFEALADNRTLEAESVIFYIETKGDQAIWKKRTCIQCGAKFLSSYTHVGMCTNECRKAYLESKGMTWNPVGRTEAERWGGQIPMVIGPEATKALQEIEFPEDESEKTTPVGPVEEDDDFDAFIDSLRVD